MPISDAVVESILKTQDELIKGLRDDNKSLREENQELLHLLLESKGIIPTEQMIEIPDSSQAIGRKPWRMRKAELEKTHRKPTLKELAGIPVEAGDN